MPPNTKAMTVRLSRRLGDFVAGSADEAGDCEDVSKYIRDLIHGDRERKELEAFERLKAELAHAFAAPESSYRPQTAACVITRNRA